MPETTIPAAKVEVISNERSGLVVHGVTKDQRDLQGFLKASGLRWSPRQLGWYLPNSKGTGYTSAVEALRQRLTVQLSAEYGVEVTLCNSSMQRRESSADASAAVVRRVPAIDPKPVRDQPHGGWVGARYESARHLQRAAVTAMIRSNIVAAKQEGLLPAKLDVSVVKREFSGGWAIDVRVKHWSSVWRYVDPATGEEWTDPTVRNILKVLQVILDQYNRKTVSNPWAERPSVWFYDSVRMDWETCCAEQALASPHHPHFSRPLYELPS